MFLSSAGSHAKIDICRNPIRPSMGLRPLLVCTSHPAVPTPKLVCFGIVSGLRRPTECLGTFQGLVGGHSGLGTSLGKV